MGCFNRERGAVVALTLARMAAIARPDGHLWHYHFPYFHDLTRCR
jgi:hypothetical protein